MKVEEQFLAQLPLVERVTAFICRRHHLSPDERDEFGAVVRLKLVEDNYSVFQAFEGRSSLQTYLTVVVHRFFLDFRVSAWGKWRPSAEARRLGPAAVLLDKLTVRDGLSVGEACQVMRMNHGVSESEADLLAIYDRLPKRVRRRLVPDDAAELLTVTGGDGETAILAREAADEGAHGLAVLDSALAALPPQDRMIVKMRFENGLRISDIAQMLRLERKPLYRRLEAILRQLRAALEAQGVRHEHVSGWFVWDGLNVRGEPPMIGTETAKERPSV